MSEFNFKNTPGNFESIKPDQDMIKFMYEVLDQNRKILDMNHMLCERILYHSIFISNA